MSDTTIPPPSEADRAIDLQEVYGSGFARAIPAHISGAVIRRCHAAEQERYVLQRDVAAVGKFYEEKCRKHVAAVKRAEEAEAIIKQHNLCHDLHGKVGDLLREAATALKPFADWKKRLDEWYGRNPETEWMKERESMWLQINEATTVLAKIEAALGET